MKPEPVRADADVIRTARTACRTALQHLSSQERRRVVSSLDVDVNGVPVSDDDTPSEAGAVTPQGVIGTARDGMEVLTPAGRREVVLTLADDVMRHPEPEDAGRYMIPGTNAAAEVSGMAAVAEALAGLSEAEAGRVLRWAAERFAGTTSAGAGR